MLVPVLAIVVFVVTLALVSSFIFFFVESPLSRRKMMTRLSALQEASVRGEEMTDVLRKVLEGSGECAEKGWEFLHLSIAGWTLVFFIAMIAASFALIRRER